MNPKFNSFFDDSENNDQVEHNANSQQISDNVDSLNVIFPSQNQVNSSKRKNEESIKEYVKIPRRLMRLEDFFKIEKHIQEPPCINISTKDDIKCFEQDSMTPAKIFKVPRNAPIEVKESKTGKSQSLSTKKCHSKGDYIKKERQMSIAFLKEKSSTVDEMCIELDNAIQLLKDNDELLEISNLWNVHDFYPIEVLESSFCFESFETIFNKIEML